MSQTTENRYRLRKQNQVVGYMRKINDTSLFYSRDSFLWTGSPIAYEEIDEWIGWRDKNNKPIYEWDIIHFKIDPDGDFCVGVVLWETTKQHFVIRKVDENLWFPFTVGGLNLFNPRQLEVFSYLFLNPDLKNYLGIDD